MPNMLFGLMGNTGIPADEKVVRATATPADVGAPAAMQAAPPDYNEPIDADPNPDLGMVNRQKASYWNDGEQYPPFWAPDVDAQYQHNAIVDKQVSTSGTAAAREAAGDFGHGTAKYAIGIEPTADLRDGGKMGNDYFAAGKPDVQETAGNYMTMPPGYEQAITASVMATGKDRARESGNAAPTTSYYDAFWNGGH